MPDVAADPRTVAIDYIEVVGDNQFDRVAELLHPDFAGWTGGTAFDREAWLGALRGFGPILARNEVGQTIVDRDQVCVVYDFITDTPVGVVPCVELIGLEDGLIRSTWLVFEFEHWPEVMAELRRRTIPAG